MEKVQIFWDPVGFEPDSLGTTRASGVPAAGDTSYVRTSIYMSNIDTPAKHSLVKSNTTNHAIRFQEFAGETHQGVDSINEDFAVYFFFIFIWPIL